LITLDWGSFIRQDDFGDGAAVTVGIVNLQGNGLAFDASGSELLGFRSPGLRHFGRVDTPEPDADALAVVEDGDGVPVGDTDDRGRVRGENYTRRSENRPVNAA